MPKGITACSGLVIIPVQWNMGTTSARSAPNEGLGGCLLLQIFIPYERYVRILKWLTLSLFAYVGTVFAVDVPWHKVIVGTLFPHLRTQSNYVLLVVGIFGTTISPYLFFWQASQEAEDVRTLPARQILKRAPHQGEGAVNRIHLDTFVGMGFSNFIALAIMITAGATLHANGITDIQTSAQAAQALRPVAGAFAETIFALGVIGTGLLSVSVLAGSAAYAVGEARKWPTGLTRQPMEAKAFYAVICIATIVGMIIELQSDRSNPGLVLERCDQRRRRRSGHGDHDVAGRGAQGHGRLCHHWMDQSSRLDRKPPSWRRRSQPCSPPPESGVSLCTRSWNPGGKKQFVRTHKRRSP